MKIVSWLVGIVVVVVFGVYGIAFTPVGNGILQPTIQMKIQEQTGLDSKLKTFVLNMSHFEILLELNKDNTIAVKGDYSLFSQTFNIDYSVNLEALKRLKPLTQTELQSSFHTNGKVIGDMKFMKVDGKSDLAKSDTAYHVELTEFNPTSIVATIKDANLEALLYMLNQKAYASATIDLSVNFKDITPHKLDGNIKLLTKKGKINTKVMRNDFNITVPQTAFDMQLDANLQGDTIDYTYALNSNLATITSSGDVEPQPLVLDIKYGVDVKELAVLKPLTSADIRGALQLNGSVKGDKKSLIVDGATDFASSETTFRILLADFAAKTVKAKVKGLKLQKALYMLKQPHYADALFDLNVDIQNADVKNLQGSIKSKIYKGIVDRKLITKKYEFESMMPKTTFNATTLTTLHKNMLNTKVDLNSNLVNLDIKDAAFNIDEASIVMDYLVRIQDLDRLYFATQRHLKGGLSADGELKKAKDLDFTLQSKVADGLLNATLHNDDFHATLSSMQTLKVLDMLIYPKIFRSTINGKVDYNIAKAKGTFTGKLSDGRFTKNQVLDLAKQYAHTDMYKENFKGDVNATIDKENIVASLDLVSNRSSIKTKDTKLNSKTKAIDSKIELNANGNPLEITLSGKATAPKVGINANKLIEKEATKAITKEVNKFFKGLF